MDAFVVCLGPRDQLSEDSAARVAKRACVPVERVVRIEDLAERALAGEAGGLRSAFGSSGACVIGCSRPRAVRALLDYAGAGWRERPITWLALPFDREALRSEYGVPWYPVIDRSRCSGCGTCLEYCLFSVYAADGAREPAQRVSVRAPLNCKTGCPACARLCPEGALIFPFCAEAELNGEMEAPAHRTREELAAALGDDPMRLLAERRAKRRLIDPGKFDDAERDRVLFSGVL